MEPKHLSIGIDFGGTSIKFGVVDGKEIIATPPRVIPKDHPEPKDLIAAIADTVNKLKTEYPAVRAIACGVPGFVDYPTGTIHNLTNVPNWTNIALKEQLEKLTGLPTAIENDANAMAYAEWSLGAAKGTQHAVCLTLGTGVGGGIIANGQMVRGAQFCAGELGQTTIDYKGRIGTYNNPGALEVYLGNNEFAADAKAAYAEAGISKSIDACVPEYLSEYANKGCKIALKCWDEFAEKLATALATTCWLLNPEVIVIGGGVANAGPILFDPLRKHINAQLSGPFKDHLQIKKAMFSNDAGILGCAALALTLNDLN